ncbi:Vacuolar protein sorting-associated protein 29 [Galdieria sulphuraria]|nr:Vacuolar protein sorting-associated protein 29 [Galdieria sulphuraria]
MVLVLTIGDLHIPNRVAAVPLKFRELLVPGKIQRVLCTGNLCDKETEEFLKVICPEIQIVKGDMDDVQSEYPERCVTNVGQLSFGLCHGHQLILMERSKLTGVTSERYGCGCTCCLIIDPGTATGAPVAYSLEPKRPSFVLLDVQGTKIIAYTYEIYGEDIKVDRVVFERLANTTFQ